jgi:hypothetical protein
MTTFVLCAALFAQVQLNVQIGVPAIRFETAPTLVEVEPGVLVVNDYDDEVFFVDHFYWTRAGDGRWYRARDYRGGWVAVPPPRVPVVLVRSPPGRYKHHKDRPEKYRVVGADGRVTEYKVKEKHGVTEVKVKEKGGHGHGHGHGDGGRGKGHGRWR